MLFGSNLRYFNELEINGENVDDDDNEDYTSDQLEPDDDTEGETTDDVDVEDDLDDFTEDEFDDGDDEPTDDTDEEPTEDESVEDTGDDLDDYTEDEFDDSDGETTDNAETGEETEPAEDEPAEDSGDDLTDFTEDDLDADGGETDDTGDDNTEDADAEGEPTDDSNAEQDAGDQSDNTLAGMEKNLFSDLSPQQIAIKNNELLQNYIELYETINTIFDSINKIPKTFNNTRPLTFIADQLVSLKDMVNYVITTTYVTRTYVENMAYYKQALVVLEQLNTMLKALVQKPTKS